MMQNCLSFLMLLPTFVVFIFLVATTLALDPQEGNSYLTYNDNHNSVQHIQSAPTIVRVAAPAAPVYEAQAGPLYATPVVAKVSLPAVASYAAPSAYLRASAAPVYSAPSIVNYAAPSAVNYYNAAPSPVYAAPSPVYAAPSPVYAAAPVTKVATVAYAAPVANYAPTSTYSGHQEEYAHPKYEYAYSVEDHHTGDLHGQQEQRDGDHVVGQYSLKEADGTVRIVRYYDDGHGFNAVVERQGTPTEAPSVVLKKVVVPVAAPHY